MSDSTIRVEVSVQGRVQGVCFRYTCQSIAQQLALQGWVRNEPDGSVTYEAQGTPEQVELLEQKLCANPGMIRVNHMKKMTLPPLREEHGGFTIRF